MKDKYAFGIIGVVVALIFAVAILGRALSKSNQKLKLVEAQNTLALNKGKLALTNVPSVVKPKSEGDTRQI